MADSKPRYCKKIERCRDCDAMLSRTEKMTGFPCANMKYRLVDKHIAEFGFPGWCPLPLAKPYCTECGGAKV